MAARISKIAEVLRRAGGVQRYAGREDLAGEGLKVLQKQPNRKCAGGCGEYGSCIRMRAERTNPVGVRVRRGAHPMMEANSTYA